MTDNNDWIGDFHKALEERKEPAPEPPPLSAATDPSRAVVDWVKRMAGPLVDPDGIRRFCDLGGEPQTVLEATWERCNRIAANIAVDLIQSLARQNPEATPQSHAESFWRNANLSDFAELPAKRQYAAKDAPKSVYGDHKKAIRDSMRERLRGQRYDAWINNSD